MKVMNIWLEQQIVNNMNIQKLSEVTELRSVADFKKLMFAYPAKAAEGTMHLLNILGVNFRIMTFSEMSHLNVSWGDFVIHSEWYNSKEQAASNAYGIYKALHDSCRI